MFVKPVEMSQIASNKCAIPSHQAPLPKGPECYVCAINAFKQLARDLGGAEKVPLEKAFQIVPNPEAIKNAILITGVAWRSLSNHKDGSFVQQSLAYCVREDSISEGEEVKAFWKDLTARLLENKAKVLESIWQCASSQLPLNGLTLQQLVVQNMDLSSYSKVKQIFQDISQYGQNKAFQQSLRMDLFHYLAKNLQDRFMTKLFSLFRSSDREAFNQAFYCILNLAISCKSSEFLKKIFHDLTTKSNENHRNKEGRFRAAMWILQNAFPDRDPQFAKIVLADCLYRTARAKEIFIRHISALFCTKTYDDLVCFIASLSLPNADACFRKQFQESNKQLNQRILNYNENVNSAKSFGLDPSCIAKVNWKIIHASYQEDYLRCRKMVLCPSGVEDRYLNPALLNDYLCKHLFCKKFSMKDLKNLLYIFSQLENHRLPYLSDYRFFVDSSNSVGKRKNGYLLGSAGKFKEMIQHEMKNRGSILTGAPLPEDPVKEDSEIAKFLSELNNCKKPPRSDGQREKQKFLEWFHTKQRELQEEGAILDLQALQTQTDPLSAAPKIRNETKSLGKRATNTRSVDGSKLGESSRKRRTSSSRADFLKDDDEQIVL